MSFSGMNVLQLERIAADLQKQAVLVHDLVKHVDSIVTNAKECWTGADRERFVAGWSGDRAVLEAVASSVERFSRKAVQEAAQQARASGGRA